jgi:hypothetical protein
LDSIPAKALRCMGECSITASPEKVSGAHPWKARNSNFVVVVVFIVVWGVRSCICILSTSCTIGYITVFKQPSRWNFYHFIQTTVLHSSNFIDLSAFFTISSQHFGHSFTQVIIFHHQNAYFRSLPLCRPPGIQRSCRSHRCPRQLRQLRQL